MADASDAVHPDIIARGRWLFLEFWECLWGRASWEPITRYITDPEPADRYVVIYAALYAVNTKCEHCHAGFINSGRPSAQVVLGHQECECSCCTAPLGYSDCGYCHCVEGALEILVAIVAGTDRVYFDQDRFAQIVSGRFRDPRVSFLPVREIVEEEFIITADLVEDCGFVLDNLGQPGEDITPEIFAAFIKTRSLLLAGPGGFNEPAPEAVPEFAPDPSLFRKVDGG